MNELVRGSRGMRLRFAPIFFYRRLSERSVGGRRILKRKGKMERRKEVIDACLQKFIDNGLAGTTTRDLSGAMKLQAGALYYYFKTKDEAVLACAEEAVVRLENGLLRPALCDMHEPALLVERLLSRAEELAPAMRFFIQVCASEKYREGVSEMLKGTTERYRRYTEVFAEGFGCDADEIEPYFHISIHAVMHYMIFGGRSCIEPQLCLVKRKLEELLERKQNPRGA